uniref:Reverse transcriptase domain-containing protein n=1 Tax=Nicotiana tabacum TaxID=4097 RepID=A0A1S4AY04_TOBAC|nr:PREDICTED: uncharacterized protein LOC107802438 [Nicotiana tabacum]
MESTISNVNGKIWLFLDAVVEWDLLIDTEQQLTIKVYHQDLGKYIMMTFVYVKCPSLDRLELWDNLYYLASDMELPWVVGGDFNVVLNEEEKIGGLPVYPQEYKDFAFCINSCGLFDNGYKGSPFTWWNGRPNAECLFKRLDRILVNMPFQTLFPTTEVEHLIRTGSDHVPLLMSCGDRTLQKLKKVKTDLPIWSKLTYGDIFKQLDLRENVVRVKEMLFEDNPTVENRIELQQAQAELKRYPSIEEQFLKQKAGMTWFVEDDRNTRFFHNHINGKRQKFQLKGIHNNAGARTDTQTTMADTAAEFFQKQFTQQDEPTNFDLLDNIPSMVSTEKNLELCRIPTKEEVKAIIFELSGESASGPVGFTGIFFQVCWDIVAEDIHNMIKLFYGGRSLPKSITHTNLVLLPKNTNVQTFSDLRPISLSNFINKVISKVIHDRLEKILPFLISSNQSDFVNGRSIFENILLTQEIINNIRLRGKPANVVIKPDMAKAYDRVSWKYLMHVLRKMKFAECFINMV